MSLEGKVLHWLNLGIRDYADVCMMQEKLVTQRSAGEIPDTLLAFQARPVVTFGVDSKNNQFSRQFLNSLAEKYGPNYTQEHALQELSSMGIGFYQSSRGGGAAVLAPGQMIYSIIADHTKVTGKGLDVAEYKHRVYSTMFGVLRDLGVSQIEVGSQQQYQTRDERKDAWVQEGGVSLKMGSKGLSFRGDVAYNGFCLFIDEKSNSHSWVVNSCGYEPHEARLTSVEEFLGRKIPGTEVHRAVAMHLSRNFGYGRVIYKKEGEKLTWQE